jgi:hypothetical protein
MLNNSSKNIALAIARAYCNNDALCQDSLFNRLNENFNDQQFASFVSTLSSRAYAVATISLVQPVVPMKFKILFSYFDVVTGAAGSFPLIVPMSVISSKNYTAILNSARPGLTLNGVISDLKILFSSSDYGYNIAYTTTPTSGGGGTGGGGNPGGDGGEVGNGQIIVTPGLTPNSPAVVTPVQNVFSGLDIQSLIIPGMVALAAYMLFKK